MATIPGLTPGTWTVDASHSEVGFVARHLVVTKVRGRFADYQATLEVGEDVLDSKVTATVQMASVETRDDNRDAHLRSGDFFDVENHPTMTFVSTGITQDGGGYELAGDLTIKGVSRPVVFDLEFNGVSGDPWGGTRAGFTAETEINRKDWGLTWNAQLETGGVLVSDKIKIVLEIQAVQAQPAAVEVTSNDTATV